MSTILPPPAVSTPAHEWAEGTTDALHQWKDKAQPTDGDYVATQVHQSEPTPSQEFPGGYPQTPGAPVPMGSSTGIGGGYIPDGPGIVETAKQYIPTGEQISSYLPAAVKGYFPNATGTQHDSDSTVGTDSLPTSGSASLPKSDFGTTADTWSHPESSGPSAVETSIATTAQDDAHGELSNINTSPTPRTSETLAALGGGNADSKDPSLGDVSTMAVVGTPGSAATPTRGFSSNFTPSTDIASDKGVDPSTKASDFKEEILDMDKTPSKKSTLASSPLSKSHSDDSKPSAIVDQDKPLPESPQAHLGARDHPLPPLATSEEKHIQGDELLASPESKPSLGTGAVVSTGGVGSTAADAGHSTASGYEARPSTDTTGSKFHETSSKISEQSGHTTGSGKVKFTDKIKGEVKILSGKMSHDEAKIEEGRRLMGKV